MFGSNSPAPVSMCVDRESLPLFGYISSKESQTDTDQKVEPVSAVPMVVDKAITPKPLGSQAGNWLFPLLYSQRVGIFFREEYQEVFDALQGNISKKIDEEAQRIIQNVLDEYKEACPCSFMNLTAKTDHESLKRLYFEAFTWLLKQDLACKLPENFLNTAPAFSAFNRK